MENPPNGSKQKHSYSIRRTLRSGVTARPTRPRPDALAGGGMVERAKPDRKLGRLKEDRPVRIRGSLQRIFPPGRLQRLLLRGAEPLHLNLMSIAVALCGSYRAKVYFDLVRRQYHAFSILFAADLAIQCSIKTVQLIEFGVASGAGLVNICRLAERTTKATGINFRVVGFDSGRGMPAPVDYRDLPNFWNSGDYPMGDVDKLRRALPDFADLIIGDVEDTIPRFLESNIDRTTPIGFISIDLDYYSSTKKALRILTGDAQFYLPVIAVYLDDIEPSFASPWTGELLAINEFNQESQFRKIAPFTFLRPYRIFKNSIWIDKIYAAHIHDHEFRFTGVPRRAMRVL
jgi:hypothetical protein